MNINESISGLLGSPSALPIAKTARGWDAYQRMNKQDGMPEFKASKTGEDLKFASIDGQPPKLGSTERALEFAPLLAEGIAKQRSSTDLFTGAEMNAAVAHDDSQAGKTDRARQAAEKLVATTLVEPILKQLRETNNAAPPFGPTKAEKQFGSFLDASLSQQIVSSAQFPLVKRIQQDLIKHSGYMDEAAKATNERTPMMLDQTLDLVG